MRKLQNKIIKAFIIYFILLSVVNTVIDGVFDIIVEQIITPTTSLPAILMITFLNIIIRVAILIVMAWFFQKRTKNYFNEEINRQLQEKHILYSSITHDLKTPMTSIKGYAKALIDGKVAEEDKEKTYIIINQKTDQMTSMLEGLLTYSQLDFSREDSNIIRTNLSQLTTEIIADNYNALEEHNIILEMDVEDEIYLECSSIDYRRILENLISNVINHNPMGTKLRVELKEQSDMVSLIVADDGVEVNDKNIFKPFYKKDPSRQSGKGHGLGLSIVESLAKKYDGRAFLKKEEDGYTKAVVVEFKIYKGLM